jgi:tRNA G18 (ribose-2'-O)-methylase SpoU
VIISVDDPDDPRLSDFARMNEPDFRIKLEAAREQREGFFVVEGTLPLRTLLGAAARDRIRSVLVTPQQLDLLAEELEGLEAPVYVAARDLLREIVGFDLHRGVVASVARPPLPSLEALIGNARLVAVYEKLNDHENLGVLFRNAAAFGVDAILLDPECADPWYRRCVRVSIGHVVTVPWTRIAPWPGALADLRAAGFCVIALTPSADAIRIDDFAAAPPDRVAMLLGAEGSGLTDAALGAADVRVRIPMRAGVDSLNVATAAAVAFHRLARV